MFADGFGVEATVPTVGVLGQTRRWFTYSTQPIQLGITLIENYFSQIGNVITIQSDALSSISSAIVIGLQSGNFQRINLGSVESSFAVSSTNPSIVDGPIIGIQLFSRLDAPKRSSFGTADGWGDLGQIAMPAELLVAPGSGGLSGRTYYVVAGGDITIAPSTKAVWSLICVLTGSGRNNGLLRADTIVNAQSVQVAYSNRNPFVEPKLQLSLGVSLQGSLPGATHVTLKQFEIQSF